MFALVCPSLTWCHSFCQSFANPIRTYVVTNVSSPYWILTLKIDWVTSGSWERGQWNSGPMNLDPVQPASNGKRFLDALWILAVDDVLGVSLPTQDRSGTLLRHGPHGQNERLERQGRQWWRGQYHQEKVCSLSLDLHKSVEKQWVSSFQRGPNEETYSRHERKYMFEQKKIICGSLNSMSCCNKKIRRASDRNVCCGSRRQQNSMNTSERTVKREPRCTKQLATPWALSSNTFQARYNAKNCILDTVQMDGWESEDDPLLVKMSMTTKSCVIKPQTTLWRRGPKFHCRKKCRRRRSSSSASLFLVGEMKRTAHVSKRAHATPKSKVCTTPSRSRNKDAVTTVTHHFREGRSRAINSCSTPAPTVTGRTPWRPRSRESISISAAARLCLSELQEEMLRFLRPSSANFARQHDQTCPPESSCQFRVRACLPPSICAQHCPILFRSTPVWTCVAPQWRHQGGIWCELSPEGTLEGRRASPAIDTSTFKSRTKTLQEARPPASLQTLTKELSTANPLRPRTPEFAHAGRWWPLESSGRPATPADARNGRQGLPKTTQEENAEVLRVKQGVEWR